VTDRRPLPVAGRRQARQEGADPQIVASERDALVMLLDPASRTHEWGFEIEGTEAASAPELE
jgi:hypothetical protein